MLKRLTYLESTLCRRARAYGVPQQRSFTKKIHIRRLKAMLEAEDDGLCKQWPDQRQAISLEHAVRFAVLLSRRVFDETVQVQLNMNLDARKADQLIRANIYLPHGTGQEVRVLVFCPEKREEEAKNAGADLIANDEILADIKKGVFNFDRVIATPDQMRRLKDVARNLGPAGLMPNPKMGTLTTNIVQALEESKAGQVPVRLTKDGAVQGRVGKISMGEGKLIDNIRGFIKQIRDNYRPKGARDVYFLGCVVSTSVGRGYRVLVDSGEPWVVDVTDDTPNKDDLKFQSQLNYFKGGMAASAGAGGVAAKA